MQVSITVDMEHDCGSAPKNYRGVVEGTPQLLRLFRSRGIAATFFTTGDVARRFPAVVQAIVDDGHELGCHGDSHERFSTLAPDSARREIDDATRCMRHFFPLTSFRAPNLDFPDRYLPYLREAGYALDSSQARYKRGSVFMGPSQAEGLRRIPVSTMPSVVRLPRAVRRGVLARLRDPVVLYFHPWEFVDMTRERIPYDCRFRTGKAALDTLEDAIGFLQARGGRFRTMRELAC
ncbi:MAG TPA: polysaccharide deacetylase family protein [Stellaceae bacterium]|nr:polysaccharide deacetylase family protein [Stellaceae bacterium]